MVMKLGETFSAAFHGGCSKTWGVDQDAIVANVQLRNVTGNNLTLIERYPDAVNLGIDISTFFSHHKELSLLQENMQGGDGEAGQYELEISLIYCDKDETHGRNLFISSKGYRGVGTLGDNRSEVPVVQVDDQIVFIPTVSTALILRPYGDGDYTFVGPAHVQLAENDPCFQSKGLLPLQPIRIH